MIATVKRGSDGIVPIEVECQNNKVFFDIKPENALSAYDLEKLKKDIGGMQL